MNIHISVGIDHLDSPDIEPFVVFRDLIRPILEERREDLEAMYAPVIGRPEVDPVLLTGVSTLQIMERLPDRKAIEACRYDVRWRLALGIPDDWPGIHPTVLVCFRNRLIEHHKGKIVLEAALEAMRRAGYLRRNGAVRIDSTHILAQVAQMSRLECVRETLRLALVFLASFGGQSAWEPWFSRYYDRNPEELRAASINRLRITMDTAGRDAFDILERARTLGSVVLQAEPLALLQRVFEEQFEVVEDKGIRQLKITPAGCVRNPHDPEAQWSTKGSLGKNGWVGSKLQVCETASEQNREMGEPTEAVITSVLTQSATTSDHGSLATVIASHVQSGQAKPTEVFVDAGYNSAPALETANTEGYVLTGPIGPPPHSAKHFGSNVFRVDIPNRKCTCPAGAINSTCARVTENKLGITYYYFEWNKASCAECALKAQCFSKKKTFRTLQVGEKHMLVQERRDLCRTPEYQERMHRRSAIEGTHSELVRRYGMRRSRYRGRQKTDLQMQFTAAACNLRRWAARRCWLRLRPA